ncbi:hypothetical protein BROUX41_006815 [Berkeleyomyces rouxiae]
MDTQDDGWIIASSLNGFYTEVFVSEDEGYMLISNMIQDRQFTNAEGLLSIWKLQTRTTARNLNYIKFVDITDESAQEALDDIWKFHRIDIVGDEDIGESTIYRPVQDDSNWKWNTLRNTGIGGVAVDICDNFAETNGFYISSFDYGRDGGRNGRWLRINFGSHS